MNYWVIKGNPKWYTWDDDLEPGFIEPWGARSLPAEFGADDRLFVQLRWRIWLSARLRAAWKSSARGQTTVPSACARSTRAKAPCTMSSRSGSEGKRARNHPRSNASCGSTSAANQAA